MYIPCGSPHFLTLSSGDASNRGSIPVSISFNRDRLLSAVTSDTDLYVLNGYPAVIIATFHRGVECVQEKGTNTSALWKSTSDAIALTTSKNYILFYQVLFEEQEVAYHTKLHVTRNESLGSNGRGNSERRNTDELLSSYQIPQLKLVPSFSVSLPSFATKLLCLREDLLTLLSDGWLRRLHWSGATVEKLSYPLSKIPIYYDRQQTSPEFLAPQVFGKEVAYSALLGGFVILLSNGRVVLLSSATESTLPVQRLPLDQLKGIWAPNLNDATAIAVSNKYRLIFAGKSDGKLLAFATDEFTNALVPQINVEHTLREGGPSLELGAVSAIRFAPCGSTFAVAWETGGLALWTTFGSLLWSSFCEVETSDENQQKKAWRATGMDWSCEGYSLWFPHTSLCSPDEGSVGILPLLRSASVGNPYMNYANRIVLLGPKAVHINVVTENCLGDGGDTNLKRQTGWDVFQVPSTYMHRYYPLRYAAMEWNTQNLCVAGTRGFALININTGRWKLFGNESQEADMIVFGGLAWFEGIVISPCYNFVNGKNEIRFYPTKDCPLDNQHCTTLQLDDTQVLLVNMFSDFLVTFDISSTIVIYHLTLNSKSGRGHLASVHAVRVTEIQVPELSPHPACVITIELLALNHDLRAPEFCSGSDTLLLNVSGRLVMLHPDSEAVTPNGDKGSASSLPGKLNQPMLVASCVDDFWCVCDAQSSRPHLAQAIWLHCGMHGMKVWMPLFPKSNSSLNTKDNTLFISKRIMLPIDLTLRPLLLTPAHCMAVGVEALNCSSNRHGEDIRSISVQRQSEVFLHHILRQLLKRNLGLYALQVAATCRDLPYFSHVLELLLHHTIDEEATTKDAIPDPLLPRVVAFIQEFPEFLQTVAHCARKTELALWKHVFSYVGNPRELFEVCLKEKRLDTAASFLIILQNLEPGWVSQELAAQLLHAALDNRSWLTAKEIVRFLSAIDLADIETPPRTPLVAKQFIHGHLSLGGRHSLASPSELDDELDTLIFQPPCGSSRNRHNTFTGTVSPPPSHQAHTSSGGTEKSKRLSLDTKVGRSATALKKQSVNKAWAPAGSVKQQKRGVADENPAHFYLNLILHRFGRQLLSEGNLFDLARFAANLDFHLVLWLNKENRRAGLVTNFPRALWSLHSQFSWPFPLLKIGMLDLDTCVANKGDKTKEGGGPIYVITQDSVDSGYPRKESATHGSHRQGGADTATVAYKQRIKSVSQTQQLLVQQSDKVRVSPQLIEARLRLKSPDDAQTLRTQIGSMSIGNNSVSESVFGDSMAGGTDSGYTDVPDEANYWENLNQLCSEISTRGSPKAESQLRFLQQVMHESGCLEWSLLICLVLRDIVGLARAINRSSLGSATLDTLPRLQEGVLQLINSCQSSCPGYLPLLSAVHKYLENVESKSVEGCSSPRTSPSSTARNGVDLKSSSEIPVVKPKSFERNSKQTPSSADSPETVKEDNNCADETKENGCSSSSENGVFNCNSTPDCPSSCASAVSEQSSEFNLFDPDMSVYNQSSLHYGAHLVAPSSPEKQTDCVIQ